jgi:hypothetical protein
MPCNSNGKRGWRFGQRGTCYTGPGAKAKAARQGRAMRAAGYTGGKS